MSRYPKKFKDIQLRLIHSMAAVEAMLVLLEGFDSLDVDAMNKARETVSKIFKRPRFEETQTKPISTGVLTVKLVSEAFPHSYNNTAREMGFAATEAASFVFAHSTLDAILVELVEYSAELTPERWKNLIKNKEVAVKLGDLNQVTLDNLTTNEIRKEVGRAVKQSLKNRAQIFYSVCSPQHFSKESGYEGYGVTFDLEKIDHLDRRRHDIVHGVSLQERFPTIKEDISYLGRTAVHFLNLFEQTILIDIDAQAGI